MRASFANVDSFAIIDALAQIGATVTPAPEAGEGMISVEHCRRPMSIGSGVIGDDVARCDVCGAAVERIDSPHTNGGYVLSNEQLSEVGDAVWAVVSGAEGVSPSTASDGSAPDGAREEGTA